MGTGSFPEVKCGRGVLLTTHPIPVPQSWKSRAIPVPLPLGHTGPVTGKFYFLHEIYRYYVLWKIVTYLCSFKKFDFKHTSRLINFRNTKDSRQWVSCHRVRTDSLLVVGPNLTSEVSYTEIIFARRLREKKLKESTSRSMNYIWLSIIEHN